MNLHDLALFIALYFTIGSVAINLTGRFIHFGNDLDKD